MERRFIILAILLIALAAIASVGAVYAFTAETTNSGNDYDSEPTTIRVLNARNAANNMGVRLQSINIVNDVSALGNGTWAVSESLRSTSVSGYLDIKCPSSVTAQNPGKMRVWIQLDEPESTTLIESIYLYIYVDGDDNSPVSYKLYGADSELEEVVGEPNRNDIDIQTWTGANAKKFTLTMKLLDSFSVNPERMDTNGDNKILTNTVYFASGAKDPVVPLKINYYVDDDNVPTAVQSAYQGNVLEAPASPAGYRIESWYTDSTRGVTGRQWNFAEDHVDVVDDGLVDVGGFLTLKLYAKYTLIEYGITYNYPDGSVITANPSSYNVETPDIHLNNPTLANYTFTGWSGTGIVDQSGNPTKSTEVTITTGSAGDREYTANWEYTVTFHVNNGGSDLTTTQTIVKGAYTLLNKKPDSFTNGDLVFYGWSTSPSGDVEYGDNVNVIDLGNEDLYAIWGDYLSITYVSNDPDETGDPPAPINNLIPGAIKTVSDQGGLVKPGFIGWIDAASKKTYAPNTTIEVGTTNITLVAVYTDCVVAFYSNGGNGTMTGQQVSSAIWLPLKANTFTKTGYAFYGWNTVDDGTGTWYANKDMVSPNARLDLYAIWGHSIEYDVNGASGDGPTPSIVRENSSVVVKAIGGLSKAGCTFKGWNTAANGSGTNYAEGETIASLTSNIKLYAIWECTVTYTATEASYSSTNKVLSGDTIKLPDGLTYGGHSLTAWESGGNLYLPGRNVVVSGNMEFTAVWTAVATIEFNAGTGGTGEMPDQLVYAGVKTPLNLNQYENTAGKAFFGWSTSPSGNVIYQDGEAVTLNAGVTLYAIWKNYVTFSTKGAPLVVEEIDNVFLNDNGTVDEPDLELDGYKVEWYSDIGLTQRFYLSDEANPSTFSAGSNHELYGKWFVNVYFICAGNTDKIDYFQYGVETQIQNKDTFTNQQCWNTRSDGSGTYYDKNAYITVTSPLGLYAIMSAQSNTFTISFNANGGTGSMANQNSFKPGTTQLSLFSTGTIAKEGYTFYKWNTAADGSGIWFGDGSRAMITKGMANEGTVTLYAIWNHKVTYYGNGSDGGSSVDPQYVNPNGSVTVSICTYTKSNMVFYGWNTISSGAGNYYQPGDILTVTDDMSLYAIWAYTITFDANEGSGSVSAILCQSGAHVNLPDATGMTRSGFVFYGWNTAPDGTGDPYSAGESVLFESDTLLYAIWGHSATFQALDATAGEKIKVIVTTESTIPFEGGNYLSRDGYTFKGWYDGQTHYTSGPISVDTNVVLNAEWDPVVYTITYTLNGGSGVTSETYDPTAAKTLQSTTRAGYTFKGWSGTNLYGSYNGSVTLPVGSFGDKAYAAHWSQYIVTFNANGGYGVMTDQALNAGSLNTNTFLKKGYTFSGWATTPAGSVEYTNGQSVTLTGNITLYAVWTINTYTITYNNNAATTPVTTPTSYQVTSTPIVLDAPEKTNNEFGGWYTNSECTGDAVTQIPQGSTGDKVFWAKWTPVNA